MTLLEIALEGSFPTEVNVLQNLSISIFIVYLSVVSRGSMPFL